MKVARNCMISFKLQGTRRTRHQCNRNWYPRGEKSPSSEALRLGQSWVINVLHWQAMCLHLWCLLLHLWQAMALQM